MIAEANTTHTAIASSMSDAPIDAALAAKVHAAMPDVEWCAHLMKNDKPTKAGEALNEFLTAEAPETPQSALNLMKKVGFHNVSGFDRVRVRHRSRARTATRHARLRARQCPHARARSGSKAAVDAWNAAAFARAPRRS